MNTQNFKKYIIIFLGMIIIFFIGYTYAKYHNNIKKNDYIEFNSYTPSSNDNSTNLEDCENIKEYEISFDLDKFETYKIDYKTSEYNQETIIAFLKAYFENEKISLPDNFENHIIVNKISKN